MTNARTTPKTRLLLAGVLMTIASVGSTQAAPIAFSPLVGGTYLDGKGANSHWVQVKNDWRGTIYGDESWGTGIWGREDANLVLGLGAGDPDVVARYAGLVGPIHFADQVYIDTWSATWGAQSLAPLLTGSYQDNWAVRFSGYIAITDPGLYNFGVLYDDGFSFNLFGAEGTLSLLKDGLNPRDRLGFASDLDLLPGLYGFELTAWERLEAGVVSFDWFRPGTDWEPIPIDHLFDRVPVPTPATAWLLLPGLAALLRQRKAKSAAWPGPFAELPNRHPGQIG
jgi:hypothetical protein